VRALSARFVPVADEVFRLQTVKGPEGDLFRRIAGQGHFGKRKLEKSTRQGIYAATPAGDLLASTNATSARAVAKMLEKAIRSWEGRWRVSSRLAGNVASESDSPKDEYPADGLVLRVATRDLPRVSGGSWNLDHAWFRKEEVRSFVPAKPKRGATRRVPPEIVGRIARCHLVDNVNGQTWPFQKKHVDVASLESRVVEVEGAVVRLRLTGRARTKASGRWRVEGFLAPVSWQERGFDAVLTGKATYDLRSRRFLEFELLAVGKRWGGTQYNGRAKDLAPSSMGVLFTLAGASLGERVPPAFLKQYGW